jgi:molybdate transport system substrate-binding protein
MKFHCAVAAIIGFGLPLASIGAQAAELKVLSSNALTTVLEELGPQFEKATENKLVFTFDPAAVLKAQIEQGAGFDVAILTAAGIDDLAKQGKIDAATRAAIARVGLGVAVRAGAPKPDVGTADALKRTLLNAKSIGYNGQGASRAATEAMFSKLGIADDLKPKIVLLKTPAGEAVAKGEVEVGLGPISEILAAPGAQFAGPLPADLQFYLVFSGGVSSATSNADSAKALIKFLAAPGNATVLKAKGMEPG